MSNVDSEVRQGKNEPAVLGADETRSAEDAAFTRTAAANKPTDEDIDNMTTDELLSMSRNAESRMNVFTQLAQTSDRHQAGLDAARADFDRYAAALKEHNYDPTGALIDPTLTVVDKEGTAPTLADATGTFAADAETANVGGIGINDSNADPEGAKEKLAAQSEAEVQVQGTSPTMSRDTSLAARRKAEDARERTKRVPLREKATA